MHTANTVFMRGDLDRIVELAADIEQWPVILPHYRWVTLLEGGGDRKFVEMAARRGRIPVKWRAVQTIDRSNDTPVIHYRHIWGPTRGMEVDWIFERKPDGIDVTIDHEFVPPWPIVGNAIANHVIGPHFVGAIAGLTLQTIKEMVEQENTEATS